MVPACRRAERPRGGQFFLAAAYQYGEGVTRNPAEAVKWYRRAAEQGHEGGTEPSFGGMYDEGEGVPQDFSEALKWYRRAAEQGDSYAQNKLGRMYELGRGIRADVVLAHMWYNLAATNAAEPTRGSKIEDRERVGKSLTR